MTSLEVGNKVFIWYEKDDVSGFYITSFRFELNYSDAFYRNCTIKSVLHYLRSIF